jgi:hypothetical protein
VSPDQGKLLELQDMLSKNIREMQQLKVVNDELRLQTESQLKERDDLRLKSDLRLKESDARMKESENAFATKLKAKDLETAQLEQEIQKG